MKYAAGYIEDKGQWAVTEKAGRMFFANTLTDSEADAKCMARQFSMRWHYDQVTKLWYDGVDKGEFAADDHWGDYVA